MGLTRSLIIASLCVAELVLPSAAHAAPPRARASKRKPAARAAPSAPVVECKEAGTRKTKRTTLAAVSKSLAAPRALLIKASLHISDLDEVGQSTRRRLDVTLGPDTACTLLTDAAQLAAIIRDVHIDGAFVGAKVTRTAGLLRRSNAAGRDPTLSAKLAAALRAQRDENFVQANKLLNDILVRVLPSRDPYALPLASLTNGGESMDGTQPKASDPSARIEDQEVAAGCPVVAKREVAAADDLADALTRLAAGLDERHVRLLDLDDGVALAREIGRLRRLGTFWPATRLACALSARVQAATLDVGFVSRRFQLVREGARSKPLTPEQTPRFNELVRSATLALAERDFQSASLALEQVLILGGEPATPSTELTTALDAP